MIHFEQLYLRFFLIRITYSEQLIGHQETGFKEKRQRVRKKENYLHAC